MKDSLLDVLEDMYQEDLIMLKNTDYLKKVVSLTLKQIKLNVTPYLPVKNIKLSTNVLHLMKKELKEKYF